MELNRYNKGGREWMMVMDMDKVTFSDWFRTFLHKFNGIGISDVVITGVSNFPHIGWSTTSMTNSDTQGFHLRPEAGRFVRSFAIPRPVL